MNIDLSPKEVFKNNMYLILFLLCANIFGIVSRYYFGHGSIHGLIPLFDFDTEKNIPTLYSSFALICSSALLSFIAVTRKKLQRSYIPWFGLSLIFLFLSIDEVSTIHEQFSIPAQNLFNASGFFFFAWVIPYGIALIFFLISYSRFLLELPRNIMVLFIVSGAIFVSGAIGLEMFGARQAELTGTNDFIYACLYTCEEFLEMSGIALFNYALLTYIASQFDSVAITLGITPSESPGLITNEIKKGSGIIVWPGLRPAVNTSNQRISRDVTLPISRTGLSA